MTYPIIKNFFSNDEVNIIKDTINNAIESSVPVYFDNQESHNIYTNEQYIYSNQGRKDIYRIKFPDHIVDKLINEINRITKKDFFLYSVQYTEYVGDLNENPSLGIHSDNGIAEYTLDYQLESNTNWAVGIDDNVYEIEDNDILLLKSITTLHYRPVKKFKKNDYIKMILFRFVEKDIPKYEKPEFDDIKLNKIQDIFNNYYKKEI
jgi:hypothetical protein